MSGNPHSTALNTQATLARLIENSRAKFPQFFTGYSALPATQQIKGVAVRTDIFNSIKNDPNLLKAYNDVFVQSYLKTQTLSDAAANAVRAKAASDAAQKTAETTITKTPIDLTKTGQFDFKTAFGVSGLTIGIIGIGLLLLLRK